MLPNLGAKMTLGPFPETSLPSIDTRASSLAGAGPEAAVRVPAVPSGHKREPDAREGAAAPQRHLPPGSSVPARDWGAARVTFCSPS